MTVQLLKHKFTTQQYHLMHEAGVFSQGDRLELIDGEITEMSPIGRKHAVCVARSTKVFELKLGDRTIVWAQNPIRLEDSSEPQPDLAILKLRDDFYADALPTPADILLIIEVADSTMTHRQRYAVATNRSTIIDLLALDPLNPRSVLYQLNQISDHMAFLPGVEAHSQLSPLQSVILQTRTSLAVMLPETVDTETLNTLGGEIAQLSNLITSGYLR